MYIVYKTINKINGKYYIGVHKCSDSNYFDGYLGSGKALKYGIKKYGAKAFERETLKRFDTAARAYEFERELLARTGAIQCSSCYNQKPGGLGGWEYVNRRGLNGSRKPIIARSKRTGETINFSYIREVEKHGFNKSNVIHCLKGRRKSHKGFTFEYEAT